MGRLTRILCLMLIACCGAGSNAATPVAVIYQRESQESALRTHTASGAALQELEDGLLQSGLDVVQAPPNVYAQIGDRVGTIITFARDAGFAVMFDAVFASRPYQGTDMQFATATLKARITWGTQVVGHVSKHSQVTYRSGPGESRAYEVAASRAAAALAKQVGERISQFDQRISGTTEPTTDTIDANALDSSETLSPVGTRHALIIGVSRFANAQKLNPQFRLSDLKAVPSDTREMQNVLLAVGYHPDNIIRLLDSQATTQGVLSALDRLQKKSNINDQVFVYISSHGAPKQNGYAHFGVPVLYDTKLDDSDVFDFEKFKLRLNQLPAQHIVWVNDTCHSGSAFLKDPVVIMSSRGISMSQQASGFDNQIATRGVDKHFAVLASSKEDQLSWESGRFGVFTEALHQGILATSGKSTLLDLYKKHLEYQVPQAVRRLVCPENADACKTTQQPGISYRGRGHQLTVAAP